MLKVLLEGRRRSSHPWTLHSLISPSVRSSISCDSSSVHSVSISSISSSSCCCSGSGSSSSRSSSSSSNSSSMSSDSSSVV